MADYKVMYFELANRIDLALKELHQGLLEAEDIYIKTDTNDEVFLTVIGKEEEDGK